MDKRLEMLAFVLFLLLILDFRFQQCLGFCLGYCSFSWGLMVEEGRTPRRWIWLKEFFQPPQERIPAKSLLDAAIEFGKSLVFLSIPDAVDELMAGEAGAFQKVRDQAADWEVGDL